MQMSLDVEEAQPYFHPELEDRVPLIILESEEVSKIDGLLKFGKPIEFWSKTDLFFHNRSAHVVFGSLQVTEIGAEVHYELPEEGVSVELTFTRSSDMWTIEAVKVVEH